MVTSNIRYSTPAPGEVWFADMGMAAKVRPVLVLTAPQPEDARALFLGAPLTSQIRGLRGEVELGKTPWLPKPSAVNLQGITPLLLDDFIRRMGALTPAQMAEVKAALRDLLDL